MYQYFLLTLLGIYKPDYGINNSIIEVVLNINLSIQVILPFTSKNIQISKNIPIETKIIEGKVPIYYGGVKANSN